jgi:hypothetical protein
VTGIPESHLLLQKPDLRRRMQAGTGSHLEDVLADSAGSLAQSSRLSAEALNDPRLHGVRLTEREPGPQLGRQSDLWATRSPKPVTEVFSARALLFARPASSRVTVLGSNTRTLAQLRKDEARDCPEITGKIPPRVLGVRLLADPDRVRFFAQRFPRKRLAWVYGSRGADGWINMDVFFEPRQRSFTEHTLMVPDPDLEWVDALAEEFGLERVGIAVSKHDKAGDHAFSLTAKELLFLAQASQHRRTELAAVVLRTEAPSGALKSLDVLMPSPQLIGGVTAGELAPGKDDDHVESSRLVRIPAREGRTTHDPRTNQIPTFLLACPTAVRGTPAMMPPAPPRSDSGDPLDEEMQALARREYVPVLASRCATWNSLDRAGLPVQITRDSLRLFFAQREEADFVDTMRDFHLLLALGFPLSKGAALDWMDDEGARPVRSVAEIDTCLTRSELLRTARALRRGDRGTVLELQARVESWAGNGYRDPVLQQQGVNAPFLSEVDLFNQINTMYATGNPKRGGEPFATTCPVCCGKKGLTQEQRREVHPDIVKHVRTVHKRSLHEMIGGGGWAIASLGGAVASDDGDMGELYHDKIGEVKSVLPFASDEKILESLQLSAGNVGAAIESLLSEM